MYGVLSFLVTCQQQKMGVRTIEANKKATLGGPMYTGYLELDFETRHDKLQLDWG
jgi:hypothetical protein